ncbi:phage tail assembly protein [Roseibium sediminis]|uniref:phage tail assembly protein n=1 Tax=Roseibium sediminis TaxID=1775174 RepID=UPI00123D1584|nr:phage tail assembly protein [Roseibium sediminis]
MLKPVRLPLTAEAEWGGDTITELTIRPVRMIDLENSDGAENEEEAFKILLAGMIRMPIEFLGELAPDDWEALALASPPLMGKRAQEIMAKQNQKPATPKKKATRTRSKRS